MNDKQLKQKDALGLFIESVLKPDHELRQCAHNQKCYNELMEWRDSVLEYLHAKRNESMASPAQKMSFLHPKQQMDEKTKLILAKMQINNLVELLKGNEYEQFLYSKLIGIDVELTRQLSHYD